MSHISAFAVAGTQAPKVSLAFCPSGWHNMLDG